MRIYKYLFLLFNELLLAGIASSQNVYTLNQDKLQSNYYNVSVTAKYVVIPEDDEPAGLSYKFINNGKENVLILLDVTHTNGSTERVKVTLNSMEMKSDEISEFTYAIISVATFKVGEDINSYNNEAVNRTTVVETLNLKDGKLNSILIKDGKQPSKEPNDKFTKRKPITAIQANMIFQLIFGKDATAGIIITEEDKEMAEYFLYELINGSCKMSFLEELFRTTYNFSPEISELAVNLIDKYLDGCDEAKSGKYYQAIVETIARNYKSMFVARKKTESGQWDASIDTDIINVEDVDGVRITFKIPLNLNSSKKTIITIENKRKDKVAKVELVVSNGNSSEKKTFVLVPGQKREASFHPTHQIEYHVAQDNPGVKEEDFLKLPKKWVKQILNIDGVKIKRTEKATCMCVRG